MITKVLFDFFTLDNKKYKLNLLDYKVDWDKTIASKGQKKVKDFFRQIWYRNFCCEELKCKPLLKYNFRLDLVNIDKRVAVEYHGHPGHNKFDPYWHKTEDDFWAGLERDRLKQLWCEKNKFILIELYPQNLPLKLEWLKSKYPSILWPKLV